MNPSVFTTFRPEDFLGLHEIRPHVAHNTLWNFETGLQETQLTHIDTHWEWENGHEIHTAINISKEGVFVPFEIFPGVFVPPGVYDDTETQLVAQTNRGAPFHVTLNSNIGGFFGGDRVRLSPAVSTRVGETLNAQLRWAWNDIDLPGGSFITNLGSLRVSYSFTTRLFLQVLVQYNDRGRPLVVEPAVRAAVRREHRALRRLQRHPRPRPRQIQRRGTHPHRQIQLPLRPS